jgi:hypothetical protein
MGVAVSVDLDIASDIACARFVLDTHEYTDARWVGIRESVSAMCAEPLNRALRRHISAVALAPHDVVAGDAEGLAFIFSHLGHDYLAIALMCAPNVVVGALDRPGITVTWSDGRSYILQRGRTGDLFVLNRKHVGQVELSEALSPPEVRNEGKGRSRGTEDDMPRQHIVGVRRSVDVDAPIRPRARRLRTPGSHKAGQS